jgi:signal transduction histidine kinase
MDFDTARHSILVLAFACVGTVLALLGLLIYLHSAGRGLPYRDAFASGQADEWKAIGGTWELVNGTMRNDSDERGAKLLTGSPYWRNYSIEADIFLPGMNGDAGLIIRSGNEEEGVNAYSGYYAGIRTGDSKLVLGRAQHSWLETSDERTVAGGVHPFQWYHLKVLAYDCQIAAALFSPVEKSRTAFGVTDSNCIPAGRIGLRSYSSGGIWRNVVVRPATHQDLENLIAGSDVDQSHSAGDSIIQDSDSIRERQVQQEERRLAASDRATQSIASLRLASFANPVMATVRGVVVLAAPRLYVQDSTGGVYVRAEHAPLLKVGDEVEVTGAVHPSDFSSILDKATVRVLWARSPVPPVAVTASQAATGKFDAMFVELRGRLSGKERGPDNTLIFDLDDGPQSFRAIMNPGRSDLRFSQLKLNSTLRMRGICVVDPSVTASLTPFVLLLRSNEDLELIAGPPWWSTGHILAIAATTLFLALAGVSLYHRVENWRLRAVLEERERLALEMHDTLAQSFAGIGFQLQAIRNGITGEMTTLRQQLDLASNLVRHSHEEARRSIASLRTDEFQSEDVLSALEQCALRMVDGGKVRIACEREGESSPMPLQISHALYRIGQEAIANSVRHAHPSSVTIRLSHSPDAVRLEVEDDGIGFVENAGQLGLGVRGMRRRAQAISAGFHLQTVPGRGTWISVDAPLPPRTTTLSWLQIQWRKWTERSNHAGNNVRANSHSYR